MAGKKKSISKLVFAIPSTKISTLESRDKLALAILSLFFFGLFGVYGGHQVYQKSIKQQTVFDSKLNDYFWMRGQAGNLSEVQSTGGEQAKEADVTSKVLGIAKNFGIMDIQATATIEGVQFSFENGSQALIGRVIGDMQRQNFTFSRLKISQSNDGQSYKVEAVATL